MVGKVYKSIVCIKELKKKKSIFKKDGTINYNSEIYKKIELSAKSKKIKFIIKREC